MSNRAVIVSGGKLEKDFIVSFLEKIENPYIIGVDRGVEFLYKNQIAPSYIVGDFDSSSREILEYYKQETQVSVREYNPVKDASDTEIAVRLAMTLGCREIIIFGATGGRIDHLWANVQTLKIPLKAGVKAIILDSQNKVQLIDQDTCLKKEEAFGKYFSLFPLGEPVFGLTIEGAKYPLKEHTMMPSDSLCVSNEIEADEVKISFRNGVVILMETCDKEAE